MSGRVGGYGLRPAGSLKEAQQQLVEACGGLDAATDAARVGRSQLARYTSAAPEHEETNMPIDVVDCLERACGKPIVTEWMAARRGGILVLLRIKSLTAYVRHLCEIGKSTGTFFASAHEALADGLMTPAEAGRVKREAMKLTTGLAALIARLDGVIQSGKADQ